MEITELLVQRENPSNAIVLSEKITELTGGLSAVRHTGDYGFDEFLEQGGASSDAEVVSFIRQSFKVRRKMGTPPFLLLIWIL